MVYGLIQYHRILTDDDSWSEDCLDADMFFVEADNPNQIIIDDYLPRTELALLLGINIEYFEVCKQNVSDEWIVIGEFNLDEDEHRWVYIPETWGN